jgi:hypothetical protein
VELHQVPDRPQWQDAKRHAPSAGPGSLEDDIPHARDNSAGRRQLIRNAPNEKFIGPDWVHFDVRDKGWNEAIRANTQLYELKPVASGRQA